MFAIFPFIVPLFVTTSKSSLFQTCILSLIVLLLAPISTVTKCTSSSSGLLAGLVIGWILFIITLVGCIIIITLLVCSRQQVAESNKKWVCIIDIIYTYLIWCNGTHDIDTGHLNNVLVVKKVMKVFMIIQMSEHMLHENNGCGHVCTTCIGVHMNKRW